MLHAPDRAGLPVTGLRLGAPPAVAPAAHEATTAQLGAAYPFGAALPLPADRVLVGADLAGGPFYFDPFDLYAAGVLTNPNMVVLGQIGRGKSALVKTYLWREAAFGRTVAVLDPKGEYGPLARALGVEPIRLSPGGETRLNPLDGPSPRGAGSDGARHDRLVLVQALAEATLRRGLEPFERLCVEVALDAATAEAIGRRPPAPPTLGEVVAHLLAPGAAAAEAVRDAVPAGAGRLAQGGRDVGLELRRLVNGDLAGMFDAATSPGLGTGRGALVVDLSAVYHSAALASIMVCAAGWLQAAAAAAAARGAQSLLVVDEAWAVLSEVAVARYLRASWKLARARGVANLAVAHRVSDLSSAGEGSEEARLAEGLLADSETVVCYAQPAGELGGLAEVLGCRRSEIDFLPRLGRGVALWRVGERRFLVEHRLAASERAVVDTDSRLLSGISS